MAEASQWARVKWLRDLEAHARQPSGDNTLQSLSRFLPPGLDRNPTTGWVPSRGTAGRFYENRSMSPSGRERLVDWLYGEKGRIHASQAKFNFIEGLIGGKRPGNAGWALADFTPLGMVMGADEAARAGDYDMAMVNLLPGSKQVSGPVKEAANAARHLFPTTRREQRELASSKRVHYNEPHAVSGVLSSRNAAYDYPIKSTRSVADDYPTGLPPHDPITGRPAVDIDGFPILPHSTIVGRRSVLGGAGTPISAQELFALGKDFTGSPVVGKSAAEMGRAQAVYRKDELGRTWIEFNETASPVDIYSGVAHEVGHLIGDKTGKANFVTPDGIVFKYPREGGFFEDLSRNYHLSRDETARRFDPDTPLRYRTTPESIGYPKEQAPLERSAEALAIYMMAPDPFKNTFPNLARELRALVRSNPELAARLTLNSVGGVTAGLPAAGVAAGFALSGDQASASEVPANRDTTLATSNSNGTFGLGSNDSVLDLLRRYGAADVEAVLSTPDALVKRFRAP